MTSAARLVLTLGFCATVPILFSQAEASETWWAFRPLDNASPPCVASEPSARNGIDAFVAGRLASHGILPAPEADRRTLLRRLHQDLIGLPPSLEDLEGFLDDTRPDADAWERAVDRLLASPRHGEHWASMWLHLARYSESDGWNQDAYRPHIWRYRDYVVQAFNADKPYPDFVREQLAGDEMPERGPDSLAAAGFLRRGIYELTSDR